MTTTPTNLARQILNNLNIFGHKPGGGHSSSVAPMPSSTAASAAAVAAPSISSACSSLQTTPSTSYSALLLREPHSRHSSHSHHQHHRSRSQSRGRSGGGGGGGGGHYTDDSCSLASAGRRPSVDTVSTYLSHESKGSSRSQNIGSVSDLLDCSIGSDDVFVPPLQMPGSIVGK